MKLKLTVVAGETSDDVEVVVDATATAGQVAQHLRSSHPRVRTGAPADPALCLRVNPGTSTERTIAPTVTMGEAGVRSGDTVTLAMAAGYHEAARAAVATVRVLSGPDAGASFGLLGGSSLLGRDRSCEVRLSDPLISKRHAKLNVSDVVEIIDDNSANGVLVGNEYVQRAVLRPTDEIRVGDSVLSVTVHTALAAGHQPGGHTVEFNRSPRLDPRYQGVELVAPEPPQRPQSQRFPVLTFVAPMLMGAVMFAVTKSALSLLFIALSPVMMVGSYFENRWATKRAWAQASVDFRAGLRDLAVQLQYAAETERTARRREHPSVEEVRDAVNRLTPLLWTRRPEHESFATVRLGLGTLPSRNSVKLPTTNNTTAEFWRELHDVAGQFTTIDRVPVVADLRSSGNLGVAGPVQASGPLAASVAAQFVGLHSPAELVVAAVCSNASMRRWEWLKWLPHAGGDHSPLGVAHLASSPNGAVTLIAALEDLIAARRVDHGAAESSSPLPLVLLVVEDDAASERARLVSVAERGSACGVHVLWCASSLERVPAACRTYLEIDANTGEGRVGFVGGGLQVAQVELEPLALTDAAAVARALSPVVDAGALVEDESDLPRSVSFLTLGGKELADSPTEVIAVWRGTNSLPPEPGAPRLKRDNSLMALVGQSAGDRLHLDLRTQGPHALVGGTTGAGKSEFLQSWILGMATAHSPARVNFLFIDYKGGAAFADCVDLPHCVGLVTDLSPHLVRRALRSLNAELRRREHVLNRKKAKDLLELERRRDPETPPSLVIVVDEFAALVQEVPEFVDGVVNVAQRGRSLGLHLILATQRPAGVIKENLRANTNLRVALRMADESDSDDVIGSRLAATFDPAIPGRGVAKTGPGRLTTFQSAYVGGHTTNEVPQASIEVRDLRFDLGVMWEVPDDGLPVPEEQVGDSDIRRMVATVRAAHERAQLPPALKPWLPELATSYRLEQLPTRRTDAELVFGVIDRPDEQSQPVVAFMPDRDGNMAIVGTGGSGKSTALRSLAVAAGFSSARGGPCHVYALDFGSRGLSMLEALPHVGAVITADDQERTTRLLRWLRATIDDRAERYAKVNAASIQEYRERSGNAQEPRLLLLLDNFGAFRQAYETNYQSKVFETLESVASDGRSVGVHLIATADQAGVFTAGLNSVIQSHLALRLSSELDFTILGVPPDVFTESSPPGRGFMADSEVQVGVIGGEPSVAKQAAELTRLAKAMERAGLGVAPGIARLPEQVPLSTIAHRDGDLPALGIHSDSLMPLRFEPSGVFVVAGPPQSGRSTAVVTMAHSLRRVDSNRPIVLFSTRRSPLDAALEWTKVVTPLDDVGAEADALTAAIHADEPWTRDLVVVLEQVGDHAGAMHESSVADLVKACRRSDRFVIAEGETVTIAGWGLMEIMRADKYGIVLQPDENDGDTLFGTSFPRMKRADFPLGRGVFVRAGRLARVQVALPT